MKQAILITAYTNLDMLKHIIEWFDLDFDFFIHIDKKCKENYDFLNKFPNVHSISKYRIYWGSDRHLMAILALIRLAMETKETYSYVHLITGADFPIKAKEEFKAFFSLQNRTNYLEYYALPCESWTGEGGLERLRYYWFGHRWLDPRRTLPKYLMGKIVKLQRKSHFSRNLSFVPKLYGGGTYWSLTGDAAAYLHEQMKQRRMLSHFLYSHIGEEIWAQTILMNSNNRFLIKNDYMRFMRWTPTSSSPAVLTIDDYADICRSNAFFARKIVKGHSDALIEKLMSLSRDSDGGK